MIPILPDLGLYTGGHGPTPRRRPAAGPAHTELVELEGFRCEVVALRTLIALKRAAGRPKDFEALAELDALLDERDTPS